VAKLREIGIARTSSSVVANSLWNKEFAKDSPFPCNVPYEAVIEEMDVEHSIYEVPLMLQRDGWMTWFAAFCGSRFPPPICPTGRTFCGTDCSQHRVRIGVVGKYIGLQDAYKIGLRSDHHGGIANDTGVEIEKLDAEEIEKNGADQMLKGLAESWCPVVSAAGH